MTKNTVRCSWCGEWGHNKRGCPQYPQHLKQKRRCSWCGLTGHDKRRCPDRAEVKARCKKTLINFRAEFVEKCRSLGVSPGALMKVEYDESRIRRYVPKDEQWILEGSNKSYLLRQRDRMLKWFEGVHFIVTGFRDPDKITPFSGYDPRLAGLAKSGRCTIRLPVGFYNWDTIHLTRYSIHKSCELTSWVAAGSKADPAEMFSAAWHEGLEGLEEYVESKHPGG